jgi:hypothetical protein
MAPPRKLSPHESILERFPDHAKAIGMISVEMANLDIFLGELLGGILRIHPDIGRTIYLTPKSAFTRIEIIENIAPLALLAGSHGLRRINSLIGRAKHLTSSANLKFESY